MFTTILGHNWLKIGDLDLSGHKSGKYNMVLDEIHIIIVFN